MLGQSQRLLHLAADLGEAALELLVTVVLAFPAGLVAPVVVVAALGQGRDANIKLKEAFGWVVIDEIQDCSPSKRFPFYIPSLPRTSTAHVTL